MNEHTAINVVKSGDRVRVHYTTYSHDQRVIESSKNREPLMFIAGSGEVVDGVDRAVIGMKLGEQKRVPAMPQQAFGYRDSRFHQTAPRSGLPDGVTEGDQIAVRISDQTLHIGVRSFHNEEVHLDANHPLAGETLVYELNVVGIGQSGSDDSRF